MRACVQDVGAGFAVNLRRLSVGDVAPAHGGIANRGQPQRRSCEMQTAVVKRAVAAVNAVDQVGFLHTVGAGIEGGTANRQAGRRTRSANCEVMNIGHAVVSHQTIGGGCEVNARHTQLGVIAVAVAAKTQWRCPNLANGECQGRRARGNRCESRGNATATERELRFRIVTTTDCCTFGKASDMGPRPKRQNAYLCGLKLHATNGDQRFG